MSLQRKIITLFLTSVFILWSQLSAFQNNCNCNSSSQHQQESAIAEQSCCSNQQKMPDCHKTTTNEKKQSDCHKENLNDGLSLSEVQPSNEFCHSNCSIKNSSDDYFSNSTTIDANLIINSTFFTLLPTIVEYPSLQNDHIFQYSHVPIFLLNVSFLN
jgi:hypothetical protein